MTSASLLATLFVAYVIWHGDVSVEAICDSLNLVPSGSVKSYGQEFRIPFPACRACSDSFQYLVIMTNPNPGNPKVTVNITINGISSTVDLSNETMEDAVTYNTYNSDDYMTVGTRITDKVALISSSDDIGLLVVTSNKMDGFTPLPVSSWGVFYVVVTHCVFRDEICQIVVVASKDADVTVDIPMEHQGTLTSQRSYKTQENLTNSLTAGQAWQIQRRVDLTGTTITSNVPVGVLAGAATAHVGNNETQGGFMEHLPPATQYGTEFIVFLTPNRVEDVMRIVALLHNTKVHITETERSRRFELKARQYISSTITGHVVHVESTRPIVVAKFSQSGKEHKYPTMTYISPTALHSKEPKIYVPGNPNLPSVSEVKIVVVTQKKYLSCLEGHVDHMLDQYELNVTDYIVVHYREPYLPSPLPMPVSCTDKHTLMTHAPFAVYLFIERDNGTTQVSVAPGSGVINPACEETVNESEGLFMNQDCFTLTKEDCSQSNSEAGDRDSYGLEFTFLIPEHYKLPEEVAASTIYLLVTKRSNETVNFTVSTPLGTKSMTYTMAPEKDTETVADFPRSTLALGSRITNRTVRVEATGEVSVVLLVVGEGQGTPSTLTARLLPDDVQGHEYYVVTLYQEEKDGQIQVSAFATGMTTVQIRLRLVGHQSQTITFENRTYSDGEIICETLGQFQSLQLQGNGSQFTGTNIRSSKPISVLSGGRLTAINNRFLQRDGSTEQMPPLNTWGNQFLAVQTPDAITKKKYNACQNRSDILRIVAATGGTNFTVSSESVTSTQIFTLNSPGAQTDVKMDNETARISSSKPVLVAQIVCIKGYSILTPVSQYISFAKLNVGNISSVNSSILFISSDARVNDELQVGNRTVSMKSETNIRYNFTDQFQESFIQLDSRAAGFEFGGIVYSSGVNTGSLSPLPAMHIITYKECVMRRGTPGDNIDNDCDGYIDEEPCRDSVMEDKDGDGMYNEDCQKHPDITPKSTSTMTSSMDVSSSSDVIQSSASIKGSASANSDELCSCLCPSSAASLTSLSPQELEEKVSSIQKELLVDKRSVSATRRRYISAKDDRTSAHAVGYLGVAVVVSIFLGIFLLDLSTLSRDLNRLIRNCRRQD